MDAQLNDLLERSRDGGVVVLTGAGISAESGIPTFRGEEGYWTVGSTVYHPQEMATRAAFDRMPREVWRWYLYRLGVCRRAGPNVAHRALAKLEEVLGDRFTLVTQNVDGLHLQAGNTRERTCEVHGNIDYMRCAHEGRELVRIPDGVELDEASSPLTEGAWARLRVQGCDGVARPHVLWFDEYYEEDLYRSETAMRAVAGCKLLIVVGSSGAANLPMQAIAVAARVGAAVVDVNPGQSPFSDFAEDYGDGVWARGPAGELIPAIVEKLLP